MSKENSNILNLGDVSVDNLLGGAPLVEDPKPEDEDLKPGDEGYVAPEPDKPKPGDDDYVEPKPEDLKPGDEGYVAPEPDAPKPGDADYVEPGGGGDEPTVFDDMNKALGYEVEGDFEDSTEGLVEYTKTVAQKMATDSINRLFTQYPEVKEYADYVAAGGDPNAYHTAVRNEQSFAGAEITTDDIQTQEAVISRDMQDRGYTDEEIRTTIQEYTDTGLLENQAKRALPKVQQRDAEEKQTLISTQTKKRETADAENVQLLKNVQGVIDRGTLKNITISEKEKPKFYSWMTAPIDAQGNTARMQAKKDMDLETQIAIEFLVYKGFDLASLASNVVKTEKAQGIRQRFKGSDTKPRLSGTARQPGRPVKLEGGFDSLIGADQK